MTIRQYLRNINAKFQTDMATEHSYRSDLELLIRALAPTEITVINEPTIQTKQTERRFGKPDYVIGREGIPIGYIEAKDVGSDLDDKSHQEQFARYKQAFGNLIITDYLRFRLFVHGEMVAEVSIGEVVGNGVRALPANFERFTTLLANFCRFVGQTVTSPERLAGMMAARARLLQEIMARALDADEENREESSLTMQCQAFRELLIHDLTPAQFADIYAQTLAYGLFAARLHDPTSERFGRREAAELIPKSTPFLRELFNHVAGIDIDRRIRGTVDNLADLFRATDVAAMLERFGRAEAREDEDPIIHFYETFLAAYDPALRKARGVWYTPKPVVGFIVRAVDALLKSQFGLEKGLADRSKIGTTVSTAGGAGRAERERHRVQILDPAAGTGAFLAETVRHIHERYFEEQQGAWGSYVEEHLLPRLNGFEILMSSYAMAHLQLELLLDKTGVRLEEGQRLQIYLTNSLEEHHPDTATIFSDWLSREANEANLIKRDTPVMVVMGNPPYSGESANKSEWIMRLMKAYKREPGGKERLQERNPKWINDDYVKFIRYGQYCIERHGEGIVAFINAHGFLDNPTFRGMRWSLLTAFDSIYVLDLHGNVRKRERAPDGSKDENLFDIMQGVSINLFVKTGRKRAGDLAQLFHAERYGERADKYRYLEDNDLQGVRWQELRPTAPMYFFVPRDYGVEAEYRQGFAITELFGVNSVGIVTARDGFVIDEERTRLKNRIAEFFSLDRGDIVQQYALKENTRWKITEVQQAARRLEPSRFERMSYRPFDIRYVYYDDHFIERNRREVMRHFLAGENVGLVIGRQGHVVGSMQWNLSFVSKSMIDLNIYYRGGGTLFPLYLYPESGEQLGVESAIRTPNLDPEIVQAIADGLGLRFVDERGDDPDAVAPIDILDYIYAILHSPAYRERYREFLKIDFPRIPYPTDREVFRRMVELGGELRSLHLLESPAVKRPITRYPIAGSNLVERAGAKSWEPTDADGQYGRVWINDKQYFDRVPLVAWQFWVGGYQPAQKWLKDRKGRWLDYGQIAHWQQIIVALTESDRIMTKIDGLMDEGVAGMRSRGAPPMRPGWGANKQWPPKATPLAISLHLLSAQTDLPVCLLTTKP